MQLYKRLCPSVHPLVRRSIGPLVRGHESKSQSLSVLDAYCVCVWAGGSLGMDGGWRPLPTCPQWYCDPTSLVYSFFEVAKPILLEIERSKWVDSVILRSDSVILRSLKNLMIVFFLAHSLCFPAIYCDGPLLLLLFLPLFLFPFLFLSFSFLPLLFPPFFPFFFLLSLLSPSFLLRARGPYRREAPGLSPFSP